MLALSEAFELPSAKPLAAGHAAPLIDDLKALSSFRAKMAEQKLPVNVARMMFDRPYAFDRIAVAHNSTDETLQRLALQLFSLYPKAEKAPL